MGLTEERAERRRRRSQRKKTNYARTKETSTRRKDESVTRKEPSGQGEACKVRVNKNFLAGGAENPLGNYKKIFWDAKKTIKEQVHIRCTCDSDDMETVRDCLLESLRKDGINVDRRDVWEMLQVGLYLGVCKVPGGFLCNTCVLRHPGKARIFRSENKLPLARHIRSYNDKVKSTEDLHILDDYNPYGGRKRTYCGDEEEVRELKKARRRERTRRKKEEVNHTKMQLLEAQQTIAELRRLIPSSPVTSSSSS